MNESRIYVVVAETVQNPLQGIYKPEIKDFILRSLPDTKTIVQPTGRIAAQVAHVVSRMRMYRLQDLNHALNKAALAGKKKLVSRLSDEIEDEINRPFTTIVLSVPDSFTLALVNHTLRLRTPVFYFHDENEEYGPGLVMTAICTYPLDPAKLAGITDYLQLWRGHEKNSQATQEEPYPQGGHPGAPAKTGGGTL